MSSIRTSSETIEQSIFKVTKLWAEMRSKDPRTKVGAAIYDPENGGLFLGYNGFAKGLPDEAYMWESPLKYDYVIHAEMNALIKALLSGADIKTCWLVCTHLPCEKCIRDVVAVHKPCRLLYGNGNSNLHGSNTLAFAKTICDTLHISLEALKE